MGAINLPHFEGSFPPLRENIRPAQVSKPTCRELRHHHIILSAGTVTDQQFPILSSAHHDPHMGIVRVEGQIAGLGLHLRYGSAVGVLGADISATAQGILTSQQWTSLSNECLSEEVPSI